MSVQGSTMESFVCGTQVEDSRDINLPIGSSIPIPGEFPCPQTDLGLVSGNGIKVQEIFDKSPKQKSLLNASPIQGLLQKGSSVEEWKKLFNYNSTEDTYPGFWHKYKIYTRSNDKTSKKLEVKKQPLKHKDLLQKPTAKSQKWIKEILKNKEDTSSLLQESKLDGHLGKSKANSSEWFNSILQNEAENSNWVRTSNITFGFEAMLIGSKQFPNTANVYDMKALTDECEKVQKDEQVNRNPRVLAYDFQDLIKECENLGGDIYEARIPSYKSSNEANVNELAGYLDNMLHIPREMSAMAKAMYT